MDYMAGTINPYQQSQQAQTEALISALRDQGNPMQQMAPQPQQQQQAGGGMGDLTSLLGQGLGNGINGIVDNIGTANTYGTNPFSQQTNMLAAQDAAFK